MSNTWMLLSYENYRILKQQRLTENSSSTYSYGCAMLYFNMPEIADLHSKIEDRDIYTEEGEKSYGLEDEPHVTLLYGIHSDEVKDEDVINLLDKFKSEIKTIKLHNASKFENPKYEVLKLDAESDILHKINGELCNELPFTTDYPKYHPHLTIAYLKPKMGQKYIEMFEGMSFELEPSKFVYSKPDGSKIIHPF
jgi:2'-5' RNA ligase